VNSEARDKAATNRNETNRTEACIILQAVTDEEALITPLHHLATDCLRLSMYFFHLIQQCAQQIYHTALPVSRTYSQPDKPCLWSVAGNQPSLVTAFIGAPDTWGSLLRTIDLRPRSLMCIGTSAHGIIAAFTDIVDIYDAVTFVLRQSLRTPKSVAGIQASPDGSTLFFNHFCSVTMWDVQTGGLTHTFTTRFPIFNIAVSTTGDHLAVSTTRDPAGITLSNSFVVFWNNHTKKEVRFSGNPEPIVAICWMSPLELAVATTTTVYTHNITTGETSHKLSIPGGILGMVYLGDEGEVLVGTWSLGLGVHRGYSFFKFDKFGKSRLWGALNPSAPRTMRLPWKQWKPTLAGEAVVWVDDERVQSFNHRSMKWTENPPLLDDARSVVVSLNRNLVVHTAHSIQILSLDVLTSGKAHNNVRTSHVHPLGEKHIVCLLEPNRHLTILDLETLQELCPDNNTSLLQSLLKNQSSSARGFVAKFGISAVMQMWQSGTPLPGWRVGTGEDTPIGVSSPNCTRFVTYNGTLIFELLVRDAKDGTLLARGGYSSGKVYDVAFDSETRFHLKIDGLGGHVQIPHDIIASPSDGCSHTIIKGEPVPLSEPRKTPPYTLDENCEWVVDAESRKIFWVSPGNVRMGNGGHFWVGLSLVMVGDDGVVRKLTFKEPDCRGICM
jgi:hypothetical protein